MQHALPKEPQKMYIGTDIVWCSKVNQAPEVNGLIGQHLKSYKDVKKCIAKDPDVIIMDADEFKQEWRSIYIGLRKQAQDPVFLLIYNNTAIDIAFYLSRGVRGFMRSEDRLEDVLDAVRNNSAYIPAEFMSHIYENYNLLEKPFKKLTHRQFDVACALIEGKTYKTIAVEQNSSIETIRDHVKNIYRHFEINSKTELMELKSHFSGHTVNIK